MTEELRKKAFDIISPVKANGQICQLPWGKCSALNILRNPVHTVLAVIDTYICHQHLQKRNAAAIRCKAMADAIRHRISQGTSSIRLPTRGTGYVKFCSIG